MPNFSLYRGLIGLAAIFLLAFAGQLCIWQFERFTDEDLWLERLEDLYQDFAVQDKIFNQEHYSEHPGMPALLAGMVFLALGVPSWLALNMGVASWVASAVVGSVLLTRRIHAPAIWGIAAAVIMTVNPLYLQASPVDAVLAPFLVLACFGLLYYMRNAPSATALDVILGVCAGIAIATRLHLAIPILIIFVIFLTNIISWRRMLLLVGTALVIAQALNPLMWFTPATFLRAAIIDQLAFFTGTGLVSPADDTFVKLHAGALLYIPFALISFTIATFFVYRPSLAPTIPRRFLVALITTTVVIIALLLTARLQSLRYFFPLIFIWESLLPMLLFALTSHVTFQVSSRYERRLHKLFPGAAALSVAAAQLFLLIYSIHLPATRVLLDWEDISPRIKPHTEQTVNQ